MDRRSLLQKLLEVTERRWKFLLVEFSSICHKLFVFSIVHLQYFIQLSKSEIKKSRSGYVHRSNKQILRIQFLEMVVIFRITTFCILLKGKTYAKIIICFPVKFYFSHLGRS
jgi:hypothetical protein